MKAGHCYGTIFQGLTECFGDCTGELGEFVEKQDTFMRKANVTGVWPHTTPDEGAECSGMMWRS